MAGAMWCAMYLRYKKFYITWYIFVKKNQQIHLRCERITKSPYSYIAVSAVSLLPVKIPLAATF